MTLTIILDVIMCALLGGVIVYAFILNRNLATVRQSRHEIETLIQGFNMALGHAESSIQTLKILSDKSENNLKPLVKQANALKNDLEFMVGRTESLVTQIEALIQKSRHITTPTPQNDDDIEESAQPILQEQEEQSHVLLKALHGIR